MPKKERVSTSTLISISPVLDEDAIPHLRMSVQRRGDRSPGLSEYRIHISDRLFIPADFTRFAVFNHLPVESDSGTVIAARMLSDTLFDEFLPFVFQFGMNPAGHGRNCKAERKKVSTNLPTTHKCRIVLKNSPANGLAGAAREKPCLFPILLGFGPSLERCMIVGFQLLRRCVHACPEQPLNT